MRRNTRRSRGFTKITTGPGSYWKRASCALGVSPSSLNRKRPPRLNTRRGRVDCPSASRLPGLLHGRQQQIRTAIIAITTSSSISECRNFPSESGPKSIRGRVRCEEGEAPLPEPPGTPGDTGGHRRHTGHLYNFLQAVRSRNSSDLRADVLEGHLSSALVHMANISYRLGRPHGVESARDAVKDFGPDAVETLGRFEEHLRANAVDLPRSELTVGAWLEMDPESEQFVGGSETAARANQLARGSYREPFVVPEQV